MNTQTTYKSGYNYTRSRSNKTVKAQRPEFIAPETRLAIVCFSLISLTGVILYWAGIITKF